MKKDHIFTFLWVKMVLICRKMESFSNSLFSLYSSHSPSIRDFSCTLYKPRELRSLFVDTIASKQGNCCPYHCRLVSNVCIEQGWMSEVLKSKRERQIYYCETVFISKLNFKRYVYLVARWWKLVAWGNQALLGHSLVNASCYLTVLKNIIEEIFFLSGVWYQLKIVLVHFDSFITTL